MKSLLSIIFICWLFSGSALYAQVINGQITDAAGNPVGFATVFIRELKQGTVANEDGYYELNVAEGIYTCQFQCLGYETEILEIAVKTGTNTHNITLQEKAYELGEVVANPNREDLAYGIMRRVIAMAPYYLNQVSEYKAEVYLKGSLQVNKISALLKRLASDTFEDIKEGNTYLEESFSEIEFTAPNRYNQRVLRKTGTMPNSLNNNPTQLMTTSIYDPEVFSGAIISPLSTSAFTHYRFSYEGYVREDNRIISKIRIIPAHKSSQLLSGYIYIVDNYWNIHSVDVSGEFVMGTFRMQVNFGEINENIWMPVSHIISQEGTVLGNEVAYQYVSSVKYNHIVENTLIRKPDALLLAEQQRKAMQELRLPPLVVVRNSEPQSRTSARIEALMKREKLSNRNAYRLARLMQQETDVEKNENRSLDLSATFSNEYRVTVDSAANKRDVAFWETMRPVPLTSAELKSYQENEILADTVNNKIRTGSISITSGINIKLGETGGTLQYLLIPKLGFNTVDGFYVGQQLNYSKNLSKTQTYSRLTVSPEAVWAIDRKALMWNVDALLTYSPMQRGVAQLKFGQTSADFSNSRNISPFENTVSSLFFRRNYLKLYENNFVEVSNSIDIANGLQFNTGVKYANRVMLENSSSYSFFYRNEREYMPNVPVNVEWDTDTPFPNHTAATFTLSLNYTPRYYYRIVNNQKRYVRSAFPTFSATWQKGVSGVFNSNSNFDHLALGIKQEIEVGYMQKFNYTINGGAFVNRESLFFPDFKHFNTVEIPVTMSSINNPSFKLLEYYRYSASDKYLEVHTHYETPFLLLKFLPFFGNRMLWKEGAQLSYLHTGGIKNYTELGYTIGGLMWQTGIFAGFENLKYRSFGVKLSLSLNNIQFGGL